MEQKSLVPTIRFPEFTEAWTENRLDAPLAFYSKGKGISKAEITEDGALECIRYGELYTEYNEVIDEVLSRTDLPADDLVLSEANDVIIPASGETRIDIATASCVIRCGIALGGDLNIIKTTLNGVFLAYYLNNARKSDIARLAQGISVVHLYSSQLKSLKIAVPEPDEQKKIATFLSAIDRHIKLLDEKKKKLERYKHGLMQKLFTKRGETLPELRFKDEKGEEFEDWVEKKLKRLGTVNPRTPSLPGTFVYIDLESVEKGRLLKEEVISDDEAPSRAQRVLNMNDILFQTVRPYQMNNYLFRKTGNYVASTGYAQIRPKVDVIFLFHLLHFKPFVNHIVRWSTGSNYPTISPSDLENTFVTVPKSPREMELIGGFLQKIDDTIEGLEKSIIKVEHFKFGLLQKMFV